MTAAIPIRLRRVPHSVGKALATFARAVGSAIPTVMEHLFQFGGLSAVAYGIGMIYRPAGVIAAGALCFWVGTLISAENFHKNKR